MTEIAKCPRCSAVLVDPESCDRCDWGKTKKPPAKLERWWQQNRCSFIMPDGSRCKLSGAIQIDGKWWCASGGLSHFTFRDKPGMWQQQQMQYNRHE